MVLWTLNVDLPAKGFSILASSLEVLYVTDPLLETMGLSGIPTLWTLAVHKI